MRVLFFLTVIAVPVCTADQWCLECELYLAVTNRELGIIEELIMKGADVNSRVYVSDDLRKERISFDTGTLIDVEGTWVPLTAAVDLGDVEIVRVLLDAGSEVDDELSAAARRGSLDIVRLLVRRVPERKKRVDALFSAIGVSRLIDSRQIVRILLDSGIDVNASREGETLMDFAVDWGSVEMIDLLKDRGGEVIFLETAAEVISDASRSDEVKAPQLESSRSDETDSTDRESSGDTESGTEGKPESVEEATVDVPVRAEVHEEITPLLGIWINPYAVGVPNSAAKEEWNEDYTGGLYIEQNDEDVSAPYTFQVVWKDPDDPLYHVVVTYNPELFLYALVRISPDGEIREWESYGPNIPLFPERINPGASTYSRAYRKPPQQSVMDLVGTWIDPKGASRTGQTGRIDYFADGKGAIYDRAYDRLPYDTFSYEILWKFPDAAIFHILLTYSPDNFWHMLVRISPDGEVLEIDSYGKNDRRYPAQINPYDGFYWKGNRK